MAHLREIGAEKLIVAAERACISRAQADQLAASGVDAVVQRDLEDLRQVEVPGQRIGLIAPAARLHAARGAAAPRVGEALARREQLVDDLLGVVERRLPPAGARHLAGAHEEAARRLARDLHVGVGLDEHHLVHAVQDEVGHLVHAVGAVGRDAARVDVRKIAVRAALLEGDAHLRRRGLVIELHPQALEQLERPVAVERAGGEVRAEVADQVLVEPAGRVGVPRVRLARDGQVDEPVALDPLPEGPRAAVRHDPAVLRDLRELRRAHEVGLGFGERQGELGVALGEHRHRIERDEHAGKLVALGDGMVVGHVVERVDGRPDVGADLVEARVRPALGAQARMAAGALLVELREDARLERIVPGGRLGAHDLLAARAAPPVRDDDVGLRREVVIGHAEAHLLAVVHVVHVLERVAAQLREGRRRLGAAPLLAHDQLAGLDGDRLFREVVAQHHAAQLRRGNRPFMGQVGLGLDQGALHVEVRLGRLGLVAQALHAVVHAAVVLPGGVRRHARRRRMRAHAGERRLDGVEPPAREASLGCRRARHHLFCHGESPTPRFPRR